MENEPSKEEILDAIYKGVYDALNVYRSYICEEIYKGVVVAFSGDVPGKTDFSEEILKVIKEGSKESLGGKK